MRIESFNPSTGESVFKADSTDSRGISEAYKGARNATQAWQAVPVTERVALIGRLVALCTAQEDELGQAISREMGMPIQQSKDDLRYGIECLQWNLANAASCLSDEAVGTRAQERHIVSYTARGVVTVLGPANFPFSLFVWGCSQSLLAGNAVVYKYSEHVPFFGTLMNQLMSELGLPPGLFHGLFGGADVGAQMIDQDADLLIFTGSEASGRAIHGRAAQRMVPTILELGGSAPGIVCPDADLVAAVPRIYDLRFTNSGQMCDALKRLIVEQSRYDELIERLTSLMATKVLGDAMDGRTDIGPLLCEKYVRDAQAQLQDALTKGARVVYQHPEGKSSGYFFSPVLVTNVSRAMRLWNEEVFAPILPVVTYRTEEEALELANDSRYTLGSYVFTERQDTFHRLAKSLRANMVAMNSVSCSQPFNPYGGHGPSGMGVLNGRKGFQAIAQWRLRSYDSSSV